MFLIKNIEQFNKNDIFFCEPIKNSVILNGNFIRIIYSNKLFVLNGIYLYIYFHNITIEKYFNKYRCTYDINNNVSLIKCLQQLEENILKKINILNKRPTYKIFEMINNGNIKFFSENIDKIDNGFLLKISGIWEDEFNYGVTYKFTPINHL
jgi:hypothetical protein